MKQYRSYQYMQYKLARKIKLQLCHWDKRTTHSGYLYTRVTHVTSEVSTWLTVCLVPSTSSPSSSRSFPHSTRTEVIKHLVEAAADTLGSILAAADAAALRQSGSCCSSEVLRLHLHLGGPTATSVAWSCGTGKWCHCCSYRRAKSSIATVAPCRQWRQFRLCQHSLKLVTFHGKGCFSKTMVAAVATQVRTNLLRCLMNL